jgi:hypothetical protein
MLAGAIDLPSVLTASRFPALVPRPLVVLVTVPGVLDVIGTEIEQPPAGMTLPEAMVMPVAVVVTPGHVTVPAPVMVTPAGMLSENAEVSVIGAALLLPSVSVNVDAPPAGMVPGTIDFPSVGPNSSSVSVSDALAVEPGPALARLVAFTVLVIDGAVMLAAKLTGWLYVRLLPAAAGTYAPVTPNPVPELVTVPQFAPGPTATQDRPALCVTPAGSVSASVTLDASEGPVLVSTIT